MSFQNLLCPNCIFWQTKGLQLQNQNNCSCKVYFACSRVPLARLSLADQGLQLHYIIVVAKLALPKLFFCRASSATTIISYQQTEGLQLQLRRQTKGLRLQLLSTTPYKLSTISSPQFIFLQLSSRLFAN
jgi:hypothetical protein